MVTVLDKIVLKTTQLLKPKLTIWIHILMESWAIFDQYISRFISRIQL